MLHRLVTRNETAVGPYEQKAEYYLGKTLYRLELFQASLNFFDRVVQTGGPPIFQIDMQVALLPARKISGLGLSKNC